MILEFDYKVTELMCEERFTTKELKAVDVDTFLDKINEVYILIQ